MERSAAEVGAELERPNSIVSMTTTTSVNDMDDSLSNFTTPQGTPRAGSPRQGEPESMDLPPPSYHESQAIYLNPQQEQDQYNNAARSTNDVLVYRTDTPQQYYPPHQDSVENFNGYGVNDAFTTQDGSEPTAGDQPRASALLYHALGFTNTPAPPQVDGTTFSLSRPVAIPSISSSSTYNTSPVRFARLYARILQTTSITAAQFAAFIDGLNAVCTASSFSAQQLQASTPFLFPADVPHADVPREEWVRAFVQLSNARFFAPRGLRMQITTLKELTELAKLPELRGFRADMTRAALDASSDGLGASEEELLQVATDSATKLEPYIEPLSRLIPTVHRDSQAMENIAGGLANFDIDEKQTRNTTQRSNSQRDQFQQAEQAEQLPASQGSQKSKFWSPTALFPLFRGSVMPPRLPPSNVRPSLTNVPSWADWGDDFGRRMEQWGANYGKAWQDWGEQVSQKAAGGHFGPSRPACTSKESFGSTGSGSWCDSKTPQFFRSGDPGASSDQGRGQEEFDWDDTSSIASSSSSSSSSSDETVVETPEEIFAIKVSKIEEMARKARSSGKKDERVIQQERDGALQKASQDRTQREQRIEHKFRKREMKQRARAHKRQTKRWKRAFKKELKAAKHERLPSADVNEIHRRRMHEFAQMNSSWAEAMAHVAQMPFDPTALRSRPSKAERRAARAARVDERRAMRGRGRGRDRGRGRAAGQSHLLAHPLAPPLGHPLAHHAGPPFVHHVGHPGIFGHPLSGGRGGPHNMMMFRGRGGMWPHQQRGGAFGSRGVMWPGMPHAQHVDYHSQQHLGHEAHGALHERGIATDEQPELRAENMLWIVIRSLEE